MEPAFGVKGTHVLQVQAWVEQRLGDGAFTNLIGAVEPSWPRRVLPLDWYPLRPILSVVRSGLAPDEGIEEVFRGIAAQNAKTDLRETNKAFAWVSKPQGMLEMSGRIWRSYANQGKFRALSNEDGHFIGELDDVPEEFLDWAMGVIRGFVPVAIRITGGNNPRVEVLERRASGNFSGARVAYHYEL